MPSFEDLLRDRLQNLAENSWDVWGRRHCFYLKKEQYIMKYIEERVAKIVDELTKEAGDAE